MLSANCSRTKRSQPEGARTRAAQQLTVLDGQRAVYATVLGALTGDAEEAVDRGLSAAQRLNCKLREALHNFTQVLESTPAICFCKKYVHLFFTTFACFPPFDRRTTDAMSSCTILTRHSTPTQKSRGLCCRMSTVSHRRSAQCFHGLL